MLLSAVNGQELRELRDLPLSQPAVTIFPYSIVIVIQSGLERVPLQSSATRSFLPETAADLNPTAVCFTISSPALYRFIDLFPFSGCAWLISLIFFHPNFNLVSLKS